MTTHQKSNAEKTVLITGGTGLFGKTMALHLLDQGYGEIRIFSRDECKQEEMRVHMAEPKLKFYIGDVRNRPSLDVAMPGVDLVFHAAALKQVPSCEFFPMEAVQTNVIGSANVLESAIAHDIDCVVCLGTDKAVYPVSSMGMTKALMEKIAQSFARRLVGIEGATRICSVRYGNVMCSRGSVIPLFIRQIQEGKPITITEPLMTRFMLPLRDSVRLVEFAFQNAQQGDIFMRKAAACTVGDLAEALRQLFRSDAQVKTIGIRHGEKLHETLARLPEVRRSEDLGEFLRIPMDGRDLNYNQDFTGGESLSSQAIEYNSQNTAQLTVDQVKELLLSLPEICHELELAGLPTQA